jgi:hypothetical protein
MDVSTEDLFYLPQMLRIATALFLSRKEILLTYMYSLTVAAKNKIKPRTGDYSYYPRRKKKPR